MFSMLLPIVIFLSLEQYPKAPFSIPATPLPITTLLRLLHPLNAYLSINVTLSAIDTFLIFV